MRDIIILEGKKKIKMLEWTKNHVLGEIVKLKGKRLK
jgi:hypothetical protein